MLGIRLKRQPPLFDGAHSRQWWATRDEGKPENIQAYWETRAHPGRAALAETVAALPGGALLEIGCHAGQNLWAIERLRRYARVAGTELSRAAAAAARANFPHAEIIETAADTLPFPDKSFDIVVVAGVLVCIGPESIKQSLREITRVCRRWLVIMDAYEDRWRYASVKGRIDPYPNTTYWVRNYPRMLRDGARTHSIHRLPKQQCIGHLNSIAVLETAH